MKCIVLGANGFIGSAIATVAGLRDYEVVPITRANYDSCVGMGCNILINANGNSKKYLSNKDPGLDFDLSVRSVMRSLVDFKYDHYVMLSSMDVYNNKSNPIYNHESILIEAPRLSVYGAHKYLAENLVKVHAKFHTIFRMGGFVGKGLKKNSVFDMLNGNPLFVHPDSSYQYLNTIDLASIVLSVVETTTSPNEIYNIAGTGTITLREIASWLDYNISSPEFELLPKDICDLNIGKLRQRHEIPQTRDTVRRFIQQAKASIVV